MAKKILFSEEGRRNIQKGVDILANAVKVTLGPKGKVVIFRRGDPIFSLDGVTVANSIELKDPAEAIGCDLIKDIAQKTDREAGDGTSTAIILSQYILKEGLKAMAAGVDTIRLRKGLAMGLQIAVETIKKISRPLKRDEDIMSVGTIASRDPEIGKVISDIIKKVGKEAIIAVEESHTIGIQQEIVKGLQFENGFISPYMVTHTERGEVIIEKPHIFTTTQVVTTNQEILPILQDVFSDDNKALLIIADEVSGEALPTIILNKLQGRLKIAAVKAPGYGDDKRNNLQDIAILTGANLIAEEVGKKVEDTRIEDLGQADRIIINKDRTIIIGGKGKQLAIQKRIKELELVLKKEESEYHKESLKKRISKLKGGIAIIKVGTISEQENKEKRYRIEDAVRATMSAIEEGIVPGAGMTLIECAGNIEKSIQKEKNMSIRMGLQILKDAIEEPAKQIIRNAGGNPDVILENVKYDLSTGYNSETGEYVDLLKAGIIDPAKVVRVALQNAVSVISLCLVTEAVIVDIPEEEDKKK